MKPLKYAAPCLFVLVVAAGCASTKITEHESKVGTEKIARPDHIYVYPFAATPADIPSWSAAAGRYSQPTKPQAAEEIETGRRVGALVAKELVAKIRGMGLSASEGGKQTAPRINDLLIIGYFEAIEEGSAGKRVALGFGAGAAGLKTSVEGYQMTNEGLRLLGSGKVQSGGGKTPGVLVPLAVFAATANPIGLVVGGTAKVVGEVRGGAKIEGAAKRTAGAIADRLRVRFKEQGWIR